MHTPDLTLTDVKRVIEAIRKQRSMDLCDHIFFPLKRSFEQSMILYGLKSVDGLIDRINNDKHFVEEFIKDTSIGSTEMFRDPSFWSLLKKNILPSLMSNYKEKIKVWFPYCVTGDELYSFLILLKESEWQEKIEVHASSHSALLLNSIKNGIFKQQKTAISTENYKTFEGKVTLDQYLQNRNSMMYRDSTLAKNVSFFQQPLHFANSPTRIHLVIFRNKFIYMNQSLQERLVQKIYESLLPGGILALGTREQVENLMDAKFKFLNREESIYKRI